MATTLYTGLTNNRKPEDNAQDKRLPDNRRLTEDDTILLAETFKLLGDPSRLRIVLALLENPVPVGVLAEQLSLSPSLVSHHLRLLKAARLVRAQRRGRSMHYRVHDHHIHHVLEDLISHITEESD